MSTERAKASLTDFSERLVGGLATGGLTAVGARHHSRHFSQLACVFPQGHPKLAQNFLELLRLRSC
jgi:hypothetical protein